MQEATAFPQGRALPSKLLCKIWSRGVPVQTKVGWYTRSAHTGKMPYNALPYRHILKTAYFWNGQFSFVDFFMDAIDFDSE